jgi:epoxyqueuosine reductase
VLDATRCLSYWTQSSSPAPEDVLEALGDRVYGCDICQDVCPWNRGVEKRRAGDPGTRGVEPHVSLVDWLTADDDDLAARYDRLFVPRNDPRYLRRNALVALGNGSGDPELARPFAEGDDPLLREQAEWALRRRA